MREYFIGARKKIIEFIGDGLNGLDGKINLTNKVTAGRTIPLSDPYLENVFSKDVLPIAIVSLTELDFEEESFQNDIRNVDYQIDIIEAAKVKDSSGLPDVALDESLDEILSDVITVLRKKRTFFADSDDKESQVKIEKLMATKRTDQSTQGNPLIGGLSIKLTLEYNQQDKITADEDFVVGSLNIKS